jgi:toxin CcdB
MQSFDVFRNPDSATVKRIPYYLIVQSELLDDIPTRVVIPLVVPQALSGPPAKLLNPEFDIEGQRVLMLTQQLAGVAAERLKARVSHLGDREHDILQALNFLFSGVQHCPS